MDSSAGDIQRTMSPGFASAAGSGGSPGSGGSAGARNFGKDLWCCFDVVIANVESDVPLLKDVASFFKSIAETERTYATEVQKSTAGFMKKLTTKHSSSSIAMSAMLNGLISTCSVMTKESQAHLDYATALEFDAVKAFDDLGSKCAQIAKSFGQDGRNLQKEERDQLAAHTRARTNFLKAAEEEEQNEAALADARIKNSKDLDKFDKKHSKLMQTLEQTHDEYAEEVSKTNYFIERLYSARMVVVLDALQVMYEEVRTVAKTALTAANALSSTMLRQTVTMHEELGGTLSQLAPTTEVQSFISSNLPPTKKPEVLTFVFHEESPDTTRRRRLERQATPRGVRLNFTPTQQFAIPLDRTLDRQVNTHANLKVPRILRQMFAWINQLGGHRTEGMFRLLGSRAAVDKMREALDEGVSISPTSALEAGTLLRLWLRELGTPVVPFSLYERCVAAGAAGSVESLASVVEEMPMVNAAVLLEIAQFLATFCEPGVQAVTLMTPTNISCCFASLLLRSYTVDPQAYVRNLDAELECIKLLIANHRALDARAGLLDSQS